MRKYPRSSFQHGLVETSLLAVRPLDYFGSRSAKLTRLSAFRIDIFSSLTARSLPQSATALRPSMRLITSMRNLLAKPSRGRRSMNCATFPVPPLQANDCLVQRFVPPAAAFCPVGSR